MSAKNYWFAFGVGVTAGATIALLYAPQKGVVTRKRLRRSVEDAADYLKEQAERLSKEAEVIIKRTRSQVESAVDTASTTVSGAVKSAKSLL
jgi:gas vesicle protein